MIAFGKSHPGDLSIATSGVGYLWWLATVAFQETTGVKFNIIPQAGGAALAITQVAGGHTDLGMVALAAAKGQIDVGNMRFLAVLGPKRAPGYDSVPTMRDIGYDVSIESPHIIIGPPKMPREVTEKLAGAFEVAAKDPEYQKFIVERNGIPFYQPADKALKTLEE